MMTTLRPLLLFCLTLTACADASTEIEGDDGPDLAAPFDMREDLDGADMSPPTQPEEMSPSMPDLDPVEDLGVAQDLAQEVPDMAPQPEPDMAPEPEPCATRVSYGESWIRGADRKELYDDVAARITWDGVCHDDASGNSYAELSNGWKPYFRGKQACIIGLDYSGECANVPKSCETRITYGPRWMNAPNHPQNHDDVGGVVTWEGSCRATGGDAFARLSNGWEPHFSGSNACQIALRHTQCGGLFANPVIDTNCPDPGVSKSGDQYVLSCTNTTGGGIFPIYTSKDLVSWKFRGKVLSDKPGWANDRFWAPEIHEVAPGKFVAYYSASKKSDNSLSIGAATADSALGPFTDIGRPLIHDPTPGVIDVHYFRASDGRRFVLWKLDGNAVGKKTPIFIREVEADGITFKGATHTILTNDQSWEGALVEGPWIIERGGYFYLFYSANGYATSRYGVGVARATSPTGPYQKWSGGRILESNHAWSGPGHGSIVKGPSGDWVHVYHGWVPGKVGESPGRLVLVDRITWENNWPKMYGAPSRRSQPMP